MSDVTSFFFFRWGTLSGKLFFTETVTGSTTRCGQVIFLEHNRFCPRNRIRDRPVNLVHMFPRSTQRKVSSTHPHDRCKSGFDPFLPTAEGLLCNLIMMNTQHFSSVRLGLYSTSLSAERFIISLLTVCQLPRDYSCVTCASLGWK